MAMLWKRNVDLWSREAEDTTNMRGSNKDERGNWKICRERAQATQVKYESIVFPTKWLSEGPNNEPLELK